MTVNRNRKVGEREGMRGKSKRSCEHLVPRWHQMQALRDNLNREELSLLSKTPPVTSVTLLEHFTLFLERCSLMFFHSRFLIKDPYYCFWPHKNALDHAQLSSADGHPEWRYCLQQHGKRRGCGVEASLSSTLWLTFSPARKQHVLCRESHRVQSLVLIELKTNLFGTSKAQTQ